MVLGEAAATVSAVVNTANFIMGSKIEETDSTLLKKIIDLSNDNAIVGPLGSGKIVADSPMVKCLTDTISSKDNGCPPGSAYVFFDKPSTGKSTAARFFCRKGLKESSHRSILVSALGGTAQTYFEKVAQCLQVEFSSDWAYCLVSAMTAAPNTKPPFLILDEFNTAGKDSSNIDDMDTFMRVCQERGFYLIIITSKEDIANKLIALNAWQKNFPLQSVHDGPVLGQQEDKKPAWKGVEWSSGLQTNSFELCRGTSGRPSKTTILSLSELRRRLHFREAVMFFEFLHLKMPIIQLQTYVIAQIFPMADVVVGWQTHCLLFCTFV